DIQTRGLQAEKPDILDFERCISRTAAHESEEQLHLFAAPGGDINQPAHRKGVRWNVLRFEGEKVCLTDAADEHIVNGIATDREIEGHGHGVSWNGDREPSHWSWSRVVRLWLRSSGSCWVSSRPKGSRTGRVCPQGE